MPKYSKNCTDTQGVPIATCNPTKAGLIPSTTNQFVSLLHDLCKIKCSIDAFYEAQTEGPMFDDPSCYLSAEGSLCSAIGDLAEYVGWFMTDEFQKSA